MHVQQGQRGYPLRPEHVESLFWAHRTTKADEWIRAGADVLHSLERLRLPCGYAAVSDVINGTLEDKVSTRPPPSRGSLARASDAAMCSLTCFPLTQSLTCSTCLAHDLPA